MPRPSNITPIYVCSSQQYTFRASAGLSVKTLFKKTIWTPYKRVSNTGAWDSPSQTMHWSAWRSSLQGQFCLRVQLSTGSVLNCWFSGNAALSIGSITGHKCTTQDHLRRERTWKTEGSGQQHVLTAACFTHWHHQHHWQEQWHSTGRWTLPRLKVSVHLTRDL